MGELGNLKDRLNALRKEAKLLARAQLNLPQEGIVPLHDGRIGDRSIRELSMRSYNTENVFLTVRIQKTGVPDTLKCQGCAPWAHSKNLALFSILIVETKIMHNYEPRSPI